MGKLSFFRNDDKKYQSLKKEFGFWGDLILKGPVFKKLKWRRFGGGGLMYIYIYIQIKY